MSEQDDNRLYIRIYADDEPSRKVEKLYQICGETESQEVTQWLKKYFPSADRPTGKWIMNHDGIIFNRAWGVCSRCRNTLDFDGLNAGRGDANYCPNCGAKMRGKEE